MARTPLQVLEDDVREEARRSTAKKLVALYWAIPVACLGAAIFCLAQIPVDAQFFAVLAAILAAAVGASLGFGLTWTFWVVAKDDEIASRDARIDVLKRQISAKDAEIDELKERISDSEDPSRKVQEQIRTPSGKLCCNMTAVRTLPTETVGAMLDAFDHGGGMDFGPHEQAVRKSVESGDGIFVIGRMFFMGYYGEENGSFMLTKEWREFMDDADTLAEIRGIVRSAGPAWKTIGD